MNKIIYFFAYDKLMDKKYFKKYDIHPEDIKFFCYVFAPNRLFTYRTIIDYKNDFGHPNIEFNCDTAAYGIVYKISEKNFFKIVEKKCRSSKNNKKYSYIYQNISVINVDNINNSFNALTIIINPLRLGDEEHPEKENYIRIKKATEKIENPLHEHVERIQYCDKFIT